MIRAQWHPALLVMPSGIHSAERRNLAPDHPNKYSITRKFLFRLGLLDEPKNRISTIGQDFLEDSIYVTALSWLGAQISVFARLGGHVPFQPSFAGTNIWSMPAWASRLLHKVRMVRRFSAFWAIGMSYVSSYNLLTGFLGFPINEDRNFQPQASLISVVPAAWLYAFLNPSQRPERLWVGRTTPFVGRFALAVSLGGFIAYSQARRLAGCAKDVDREATFYKPWGRDSYYETLVTSAPSADLVAEMPYIPFYKVPPALPNFPIHNPDYDPEYVENAKAEVRRKLDQFY